ncbi:MAG TPA: sensor domain-containing diguanylate cyclase [Nitriliruptorales bacterium]
MSSTSSRRPSVEEVGAVAGRLRSMTVARIVLVLGTMAALTPVVDYTEQTASVLAVSSAVYLGVNGAILVLLRFAGGLSRVLLNVSLLVDAAWITVMLNFSGGSTSPLVIVLYLQSVAVTALFGWRTGMKLVLLHTLGLLAVAYNQSMTVTQGLETQTELQIGFFSFQFQGTESGLAVLDIQRVQALLTIVSVWLVAGATAYFASINERELRRSNQELAVLRELNTQLERSLDLADVCQAIAQGVVDDLGYRRGIVWMAQGSAGLAPAGAAGFEPDELELLSTLRLQAGPGPVGEAIEQRQPVLVPRDRGRPATLADAFAIDAPLVVVPLTSEGRVLGLLTVEVDHQAGRAPRIKGRDLRILGTLATEASLALDNARLHAELRDLSVTDALTGVYNHRHFQQRLQEELDRTVRRAAGGNPKPVSLILMDLDLFKKVNDRFGHQAGDELLKSLARLTGRVLRSSDVVCRYGGEEFVVILPETGIEAATQVAERLREAIERSNFTASDGRFLGQVTASFGVATYDEGLPSRSDLIRESDASLYVAKNAGRNVVAVGDQIVPTRFGIGRRVQPGHDPREEATAGIGAGGSSQRTGQDGQTIDA